MQASGSQGRKPREYLSRRRTNAPSSESEESDYPPSSDGSFSSSSTINGDDAESNSGSTPTMVKGTPTILGPTLNMVMTLKQGVAPEYIVDALNSPQVKEEFIELLYRIATRLYLDTPLPATASDWIIMKNQETVSMTFHVNSCSSTDDIFENKWDSNARRDSQAEYEAMSSWYIVHPCLPDRTKSVIPSKKSPNPLLLFWTTVSWTTVLTNILALVGLIFIIYHSIFPLDATIASLEPVLSSSMEFSRRLWEFLVSAFFRPLFLRFFLVLINS